MDFCLNDVILVFVGIIIAGLFPGRAGNIQWADQKKESEIIHGWVCYFDPYVLIAVLLSRV